MVSIKSLTKREVQVMESLSKGLKNSEIGEELDIAVNTVKNHLKSAIRKLGASNRTHAVTIYLPTKKAKNSDQ